MSDVLVLYKSCAAHLAKLITLFAEFNCFDYRFLRLQTIIQLNGKMLNHVSSICLRETFLLMKLNCFTTTKSSFSSFKEYQPNAINCKMMGDKRWAK